MIAFFLGKIYATCQCLWPKNCYFILFLLVLIMPVFPWEVSYWWLLGNNRTYVCMIFLSITYLLNWMDLTQGYKGFDIYLKVFDINLTRGFDAFHTMNISQSLWQLLFIFFFLLHKGFDIILILSLKQKECLIYVRI